MRRTFASAAALGALALLAACEPQPRIEIYPTTAEARARPFPVLVPIAAVEAAGGPPRLRPGEPEALVRQAEALVASAPQGPPIAAAEIARAEALRGEAARLREEGEVDIVAEAEDLRARAAALRAGAECEAPGALPPCPAPDS